MRTKVMLIDSCSERANTLQSGFDTSSFEVVITLSDIKSLGDKVKHISPDVIVVGTSSPNQVILDELSSLAQLNPLPVVLFANKEEPDSIQKTIDAGVSAFVVDNLEPHRVASIVKIAIARFKEKQDVLIELDKTRTKLAERKVLEKAKGLLMAEKGISEDEAYAFLRKMAMNKGLKIGAVAENIVDVMGLLQQQSAQI